MEKEVQTRLMHDQRFGERERFAHKTQNELNVSQGVIPALPHVPLLLFPSRLLNVALLESPPGRHSKNRCSNGLSDIEVWLPTNADRFFHFDLPLVEGK
jgi:hypothetical protein